MESKIDKKLLRRVAVLCETDSAYAAARAMRDCNIGCVAVCDKKGRLSGILTDRDLVTRAICDALDPGLVKVRHLMSPDPVTMTLEDPVPDLIRRFRKHGIRRLVVVDAGRLPWKKILGVVSLDDLMVYGLIAGEDYRQIISIQLGQQFKLAPEGRRSYRHQPTALYSVPVERVHELVEDFKERRQRSRARQSQGKLLHLVEDCLNRQNLFEIDRERISNGFDVFLKGLVSRMMPRAAEKLIAQLPSLYSEMLLSEKAGPDKSIVAEKLARKISKKMQLDLEDGRSALRGFIEALTLSISTGEVRSLCSQLPLDLRDQFEKAIVQSPSDRCAS